ASMNSQSFSSTGSMRRTTGPLYSRSRSASEDAWSASAEASASTSTPSPVSTTGASVPATESAPVPAPVSASVPAPVPAPVSAPVPAPVSASAGVALVPATTSPCGAGAGCDCACTGPCRDRKNRSTRHRNPMTTRDVLEKLTTVIVDESLFLGKQGVVKTVTCHRESGVIVGRLALLHRGDGKNLTRRGQALRIGVASQEGLCLQLALFRKDRTGGVQKMPARLQHAP